MTEGRTHFPRPSRPSERPMPLPVRYCGCPVAAYPSLLTAGAHIAEADPAQRIAADPSVIDAERDPLYAHGVQRRGAHETSSTPHRRAAVARSDSADPRGWVSPSRPEAIQGHAATAVSVAPTGHSVETWGHRPAATHETAGGIPGSAPAGQISDAEHAGQSRLSRWQEQR